MPFPWKKNRVTRISQIVSDLQSPKRGGSLVVETGFPTSLIDLFVKNRNRFKKSRFKKPLHSETHDPPPPPPPPSPATTPPPHPLTEPPIHHAPLEEEPESIVENDADDGAETPGRVIGCGYGSGANAVIVKALVVVVLVASVKGLAVGITVSAFALLLLEYAGKRVVSYLSPCSDAVESLFQKVLFRLKKTNEDECEPATVHAGGGGGIVELSLNSSTVDEIEVVETKSEVGICCEFDDSIRLSGKVVEAELGCEIRGSRSGRFKSKMVKKLMPKKFRASKKEKNKKEEKGIGNKQNEAESGSEDSSGVGVREEKSHSPSFEIEEVLEDDVGKEELKKIELGCIRDYDGVDFDCGTTCSQGVGNSGYIILLVIALVGLLVGRLPALVLTMSWCFSLKIVSALWRSQKVPPMIKCSAVPNS